MVALEEIDRYGGFLQGIIEVQMDDVRPQLADAVGRAFRIAVEIRDQGIFPAGQERHQHGAEDALFFFPASAAEFGHEYSFSSIEDPKDVAEKIREAAEREDQLLDAENIENYPTPDIQEEECRLSVEKEAEILPEDLSAEEIISRLQKISDEGAAEDPRILECVAYLSSTHVKDRGQRQ